MDGAAIRAEIERLAAARSAIEAEIGLWESLLELREEGPRLPIAGTTKSVMPASSRWASRSAKAGATFTCLGCEKSMNIRVRRKGTDLCRWCAKRVAKDAAFIDEAVASKGNKASGATRTKECEGCGEYKGFPAFAKGSDTCKACERAASDGELREIRKKTHPWTGRQRPAEKVSGPPVKEAPQLTALRTCRVCKIPLYPSEFDGEKTTCMDCEAQAAARPVQRGLI